MTPPQAEGYRVSKFLRPLRRKRRGIRPKEIQPDETHHHQLGICGLSKLITTPEAQEQARKAMNLTLSIADEMKKAAEKKVGLKTLPGC